AAALPERIDALRLIRAQRHRAAASRGVAQLERERAAGDVSREILDGISDADHRLLDVASVDGVHRHAPADDLAAQVRAQHRVRADLGEDRGVVGDEVHARTVDGLETHAAVAADPRLDLAGDVL